MSLNSEAPKDDDPFLNKYLPGSSPAMKKMRLQVSLLNQMSNCDLIRNVLILGESGSGKNYTAKVVAAHREFLFQSCKGSCNVLTTDFMVNPNKFAEINLVGIPDSLIESELFGTMEGAYTDAKTRKGYLEEGWYTDILLDEIGDLSPVLQPKLLRLLSEGKFHPLGSSLDDERSTEARIILATNRNLPEMVKGGLFREDLLWRCGEFVIEIPPLRLRSDAIYCIAKNIIAGLHKKQNVDIDTQSSLGEKDLAFARQYSWPGNVRQLKHAISRFLVYQNVSLQTCAMELERELLCQGGSKRHDLEDVVFKLLDQAANDLQTAAETPGIFVEKYFTNPVRKAMGAWLEQRSPRPNVLESMFPGQQNANSVRSTISKWKKVK